MQRLLPQGVAIAAVELQQLPFLGYRVRVHAVPSDPTMESEDQRRRLEWFLAALKQGDPGFIEDREVVKRVISSGATIRHEFEIFLDTHPLVQPAADVAVVTESASGSQTARVPVAITPLSEDELRVLSMSLSPLLPESIDQPTPDGFAEPEVVRSRLSAQVAEGCRIDALRYSGTTMVVVGRADGAMCVSQTMRVIDSALRADAQVELVELQRSNDGPYRFELRLPPSAWTKI